MKIIDQRQRRKKNPEKQKKHKDRKEPRGEEVIKKGSKLNDFVVSLS